MTLDEATIDRLRELGATDEMLTWLRHPEAVRALLKGEPTDRNGECTGAESGCYGSPYAPHIRLCEVAASWRTLGDPRGAQDIELAHEEALLEHKTRAHNAEMDRHAPFQRINIVADPNMRDGEIFGIDAASFDLWRRPVSK